MANNIIGGQKNIFFATQTVAFSSIAAITAGSIALITRLNEPLKSFRPGRSINGITGFEEGKQYLIDGITSIDIEAYGYSQTITTVTPAAPSIVEESNVYDHVIFMPPAGYCAHDCAYKIDGGTEVDCDSTVIDIGDINMGIGDLEIYVKASTGRNQGTSVFNTTAFTTAVPLSGLAGHATDPPVSFPLTGGVSNGFMNFAANGKFMVAGNATKVEFKLERKPTAVGIFYIQIRRLVSGNSYSLVHPIIQIPPGDLVAGINTYVFPSALAVQVGDLYGIGFISFTDYATPWMSLINDTAPGATDIIETPVNPSQNPKDYTIGAFVYAREDGYYPMIFYKN